MIPKGSRVLLDTVALIYFLEENERYSKRAEKIFGRIESGQLQGVMATLVFAELLVPLYRSGDPQAASRSVQSIAQLPEPGDHPSDDGDQYGGRQTAGRLWPSNTGCHSCSHRHHHPGDPGY